MRNLYIAETALEIVDEGQKIPESVVRAVEQINLGESVSEQEMVDGLRDVADCDDT